MEWQKQHINLENVKEQYIDGEIDMMEHQVVLWIKLHQAGYTRTIQGLYHAMQRLGIYKKTFSV